MKIQELREKRAALVAEARGILDSAESDDRPLTDEESAKYDAIMSDQESLRVRIEREERQQEIDRQAAARAFDNPDRPDPEVDPAEQRMASFRNALINGVAQLSVDEQRALQSDNDASGGYLVAPEQFVAELIQAVDDMVFIRGLATVHTVSGADSLGAPSLENDPADPAWTAEIGAVSEDSTMSFGKRALHPNQLTKLVKVSMKLLRASALGAEVIVRDRLAYKIAITQEKGFLTGTGANQPLGVFTAHADGIPTGRDVSTGNTTTAFTVDGLIEAKYTLKGAYWPRAEWVMHRDAVKMAAKLKDGDGQYLWRSSVQAGEPDRLLGLPVNMSEYAPNTFTTGLYVGIVGDFSNYWIADSSTVEIQRLVELYAANSQVGFISRAWSDGMPVLSEAFTRVTLA